jgi:SAM-dependent methyltransferase
MTACGILPDLRRKSVLHFAPEKRLSARLIAANPAQYIKCDLFPQTEDVRKVDILKTPFDGDSFDLVIANHVMEHVEDDGLALSEVRRVLKPGGYAILQTPFVSRLFHTWSDPGIDGDEARLQAYGQEDHVRLYGRDIFDRFEQSGLKAEVKLHRNVLGDFNGQIFGVNEDEPFFLFNKPG